MFHDRVHPSGVIRVPMSHKHVTDATLRSLQFLGEKISIPKNIYRQASNTVFVKIGRCGLKLGF